MIRPFIRNFSSILRFKKPLAQTDNGEVELQSLTNESFDGAMKIIRESYFVDENLCKAVGLLDEPGAVEEFMQTCYDAIRDGVSVVAYHRGANQVIGVMLNKIQVPMPKHESYYEKFSKTCKFKASKALIDFTIEMDTRADLFNRYNTKCLLEFMTIASMPKYRQKKIGQKLILATMKLVKELNEGRNVKTPVDIDGAEDITNFEAIPNLVTALATSNYTQQIGSKFGFDKVIEVSYDDFVFDGRKFSDRIGNTHKTCQVVAKRLKFT